MIGVIHLIVTRYHSVRSPFFDILVTVAGSWNGLKICGRSVGCRRRWGSLLSIPFRRTEPPSFSVRGGTTYHIRLGEWTRGAICYWSVVLSAAYLCICFAEVNKSGLMRVLFAYLCRTLIWFRIVQVLLGVHLQVKAPYAK